MLEKTSRRRAPKRMRHVDLAKISEKSLGKAFEDISAGLVALAKIPNPTEKVSEYFKEVPISWIDEARSEPFSDDEYFVKTLLADVKRKATALYQELKYVQNGLEGTRRRLENGSYEDDIDDLDLHALQQLGHPRLLGEIFSLVDDVAEFFEYELHGTGPRKPGRRPGNKRYPALNGLVFVLERYAVLNGGTFTAHRKTGPKGTIVQALDLIRDRLLASPDLNDLADLVPARGKHPVAAYERVLKGAPVG
jgi:hypothetical protein